MSTQSRHPCFNLSKHTSIWSYARRNTLCQDLIQIKADTSSRWDSRNGCAGGLWGSPVPADKGSGMIALVVRLLLIVGGAIAGWFFEKDQPNFSVIQMAVAVLLLVFFVFVIGFWPRKWFQRHPTQKAKTE